MKKKVLILINIILAIIAAIELCLVILILVNNTPTGKGLTTENTIKRNYEISQISAKQNDLSYEILVISNIDDKVIDTRVTLKSDNGDTLNSKYNEIINETSIYNVSKDLDCIKYNTTINNGKEISEVLNEYSNLNFEEVTIK